ncbi:hypothetical protein SUVZ_04G4840 [Saccharomyces uvarum]|uniref:Telomere-associated protein Rif1 N-terminal domain-containing protein n=1 Tax=Saccharomyces uvarum TaxID=230603 RepID=A0ABN8WUU0_SACUV|nr:hypothetical protein SUVZ_04G4840 [Saccharomyces uvarum]
MSNDFSDKKKHTIDRIDQHILRRSQQDAHSSGNSPWMKAKLPPPPSPQARMHTQSDLSPTPKRRKLLSPSINENNQWDLSESHEHLSLEDENSKLMQSLPEISAPNSNNVSPVTKSVAFSDRIESSPIHHVPGSSPKPSPSSKPGKSILRNRMPSMRTVSDLSYNKLQHSQHQLHNGNIFTSPYKETTGVDPRTLDYWVSGEIHSLIDNESVSEFKDIIEGGLGILRQESEEYVARRFEVYATFNNIIPILTTKNVNEVDQKFNVLIVNVETIIETCMPHLQMIQDTLLSFSEKKNPFVIRLYVQMVRFFGAIMSNFKIMKWLMKRPDLVNQLKVIYKWTNKALKNENSNKIIITAQVSFLRDEKFGTFFLSDEEIKPIIDTFTEIIEINSNNLICEKLLLIRGFLSKYPKLMIETVTSWLPGEVLPRIIIGDEVYSMKILITSIVVLLELLKKCLDFVEEHERIYQCVMVSPITETINKKFLSRLPLNSNDAGDLNKITIGHLLTEQIKYYIVKKNDNKLAMDLWLSMTGLLYDNGKTVYDLISESSKTWFDLNQLCFMNEQPKTRLMSIKVWRIITYCICTKISLKNEEKNERLLSLLQTPFQMTLSHVNDPSAREGIIYHFLGVVYTAFASNKNLSMDMFKLFWDYLIAPIYENFVFNYNSIQLQNVPLTVLHLLIGGKNSDVVPERKNKKHIHSMSVIASEGVKIKDISSLPPSIIKSAYDKIMKVVFQGVRTAMSNVNLTHDLILTSLKHLPEEKKDQGHLEAFSSLILEVAENNKDKPIFCEFFGAVGSSFIHTFLDLFLRKNDSSLINFNIRFSQISGPQENITLNLLKDVVRKSRNETSEFVIMEKFLELKDKKTEIYAQNWVGSTLLAPNISFKEFQSLAGIVDQVPNEDSIENFLDLCLKLTFPVNLFALIHVSKWSNDNFIYFIQSYVSKNNNKLDTDLVTLLKTSLPGNTELFVGLLPFLKQNKFMSILEYCIHSNPTLLSYISDLDSDLLLELLPRSRTSFFVTNIQSFNHAEQLTIICWLLEGEELDQINQNFPEVKNILLHTPADELEKLKIIRELLRLVTKNPIEPLFSELLNFCIDNSIVNNLDEFCETMNDEILSKINPELLLRLLTYRGKPNETLLTVLAGNIGNADSDYKFELLEKIIARKELLILERLKESFFIFLLDPVSRSNKQNHDNGTKMFCELVLLYLTKPLSRGAAKKFFSMLVSILPPKPDRQSIDLVHLLIDIIRSHNRKFKDKRTYNATLKTIEKWIHESEVVHQRDPGKEAGEIFNDSSMYTPQGLDIEKGVPENLQKAPNIEEIQVPATQGVKDLPSSFRTPSKDDLEDFYVRKVKNIPIMKLTQREIPPKLGRSFTDETLEEVDNESIGEIDQQAKSTQLNNEIDNHEDIQYNKSDDAEVSELHENDAEANFSEVAQQAKTIIGEQTEVTKKFIDTKRGQNILTDDALQRSPKTHFDSETEKSRVHVNEIKKSKKLVSVPASEHEAISRSTKSADINIKNVIIQPSSSASTDVKKVGLGFSQDLVMVALNSKEQLVGKDDVKEQDGQERRREEHDFDGSVNNELLTEGWNTQKQLMNKTISKDDGIEDKSQVHAIGQATSINKKETHNKIENPSEILLPDSSMRKDDPKVNTLHSGANEHDAVSGENLSHELNAIDNGRRGIERTCNIQAQGAVEKARETTTIETPLNVDLKQTGTKPNKELNDQRKHGKDITAKDDFVSVEEHGDNGGFLKAMEQEASRETSFTKEELEVADTSVLPEIRIPIFKSLKMQEPKSQTEQMKERLQKHESMPPDSPPRLAANTNIQNVNTHLVVVGKAPERKQEKDEKIHLGQVQIDTDGDPADGNEDATSREATPSLRVHFSSKKSRKLVSRLRGFTPGDLNGISLEERRNLRIELLDFMMRLEYYSNRDNDMN